MLKSKSTENDQHWTENLVRNLYKISQYMYAVSKPDLEESVFSKVVVHC